MADYISREAAIEALCKAHSPYPRRREISVRAIQEIPAADVVEVVSCKDCIHDNSNDPICHIPWVKRMLDSYCSFGERNADNG